MNYKNTNSLESPLQFLYKRKITYFFLRKVHVKFHRSTLVQSVESPERTTQKRPWDVAVLNKEHTRMEHRLNLHPPWMQSQSRGEM